MQAVSFEGCFGWFHSAAGPAAGNVAVVLCPGLSLDGALGHRSYRLLADCLAKEGYPTLRFDYPGTGDSCDPVTTAWWTLWKQSIHVAADWIRKHTGAQRIVLCGLRLGATLAAVVAEDRTDIAGLILLAPVLRGRSYIRQLIVGSSLKSPAALEGGLTVHDVVLSQQTVRAINQVDLRAVKPPLSCPIVVFVQAPSPILSQCIDLWRNRGLQVECEDFAGLEPMLRVDFMNHEAPADVARIAKWLWAQVPAEAAPKTKANVPGIVALRPAGCIETPMKFGAEGNLFGILCRPDHMRHTDLAVVICSSGGLPRYGFSRSSVYLARRLALEGVASLRLDFAGIGDSVAPGDIPTHIFETDRRPDVRAAIDALEQLGYRRFAIQGICSGAFHAFHAALADTRISALLLVNLPLFQWRAGFPVEHLHRPRQETRHLFAKLSKKYYWKRLLHGRLNLRGRLIEQLVWWEDKALLLRGALAGILGYAQPRQDFPTESMNYLSKRARTLFLLGEGDSSVPVVLRAFPSGKPPLGGAIRIVPDLGHALEERSMQILAAEHIIDFLKPDILSPITVQFDSVTKVHEDNDMLPADDNDSST